jgi:hypothetical protein
MAVAVAVPLAMDVAIAVPLAATAMFTALTLALLMRGLAVFGADLSLVLAPAAVPMLVRASPACAGVHVVLVALALSWPNLSHER